MIGGFPHRPEDSFFHLALQELQPATPHPLLPLVYTFGGFPVTRVPRHLRARCLDEHPDIVVLQFASSDLVVPVRHQPGSSRPVHHEVRPQPPRFLDRAQWQIQGLIGDVLQSPPVTPLAAYLETMENLVHTLREQRIVPVVMSPFIFGAGRSDRLARRAAEELPVRLAAQPGTVYVDAYAELARRPRREMLLRDGAHLSLAGQRVVAGVLVPALKTALQYWEKSAPAAR